MDAKDANDYLKPTKYVPMATNIWSSQTGSPYAKLLGKKKSNGEGRQGKQVTRHNGSSQ
jgi:hypothetical protein